MTKNYLLSLLASCLFLPAGAQTFSDNFDSYTAGNYLGTSNAAWKTWAGTPGGADDVKISNAKAKSGSNSLYFSSTATNGGPADVVLPFGGNYNTGNLNFSMWMFVDANKKAYFNFQEQTTLGKGWSLDLNFAEDGNFNFVNTLSGSLLKGTYPQNEWFKLDVKINLNQNNWEILINDVSKGSFQNMYRQVAGIDIYPTNGSSYYIDDVSFTYTSYTLPSNNAALTMIGGVSGLLAGKSVKPSVEIRNLGTTAITSVELSLNHNGTIQNKTISGLNIASLATQSFVLDNEITMAEGTNTITATVVKVNTVADDDANDNVKTLIETPIIPAKGKVVVAEEGTGTWCQWCPRGAVYLQKMDDKYGKLFLGIAVHNNDPMANWNYDKGLGTLISGYPSLLVDRGADIDPSAVEADFLNRIVVAPKGGIKAGATYNSTSKELKVSLTTKFNQNLTGAYKIAFVLIEDSVTGTGDGWDQSNAYSNNRNGEMGGYEKLPNPVPAAQMIYRHVGRLIYPNFGGLNNSFPATINQNDSFTHNYTVSIDPSWKMEHLHVAGLLIDPQGRIDNGATFDLNEALANSFVEGTMVLGIESGLLNSKGLKVYPNPTHDAFKVELISDFSGFDGLTVYDMQGKVMYQQTTGKSNSIELNAASWPSGIYQVIVNSNQSFEKVLLMKY